MSVNPARPGLEARQKIAGLLDEAPRKLKADPKQTILGGFSQGAMLSCDALRSDRPYAGLIEFSGTLLAKREWDRSLLKRKNLPVFQSHGTHDEILAYVMAERLRDEFVRAGLKVDRLLREAGTQIPEPVLRRFGAFVTMWWKKVVKSFELTVAEGKLIPRRSTGWTRTADPLHHRLSLQTLGATRARLSPGGVGKGAGGSVVTTYADWAIQKAGLLTHASYQIGSRTRGRLSRTWKVTRR